jgi:hypothetical protein
MDRNKEILKVYELVLEQNQALYLAGKRKTELDSEFHSRKKLPKILYLYLKLFKVNMKDP